MKNKILASVVGAVVLWAGVTAYISSNTEKRINDYLEKSNKIYANNGMKMSLISFEKGFVNSNAKVSLDFIDPEIKKELGEVFKLPIVMDYEIENGPILFKNGLALGASRIDSKVNINKLLVNQDELKKFVKEDIIFDTKMIIDFKNHLLYQGKSNQIALNGDSAKFTISPLEIEGDMNVETLAGTMKLITKSIQGEMGADGKMKLENVVLNANIKKFFENGFYIGNFDMKIGNLTLKNPNESQDIKNAKVKLVLDMNENGSDLIDTKLGLDLDVGDTKLPPELNFIKNITVNYGLNGTKIDAWLAFQDTIKEVQEKQKMIIGKLSSTKSDKEQQKALVALMNIQHKLEDKIVILLSDFLVKDKTTFDLKANINRGQGIGSFDIKYIGDEKLPKTVEELALKLQKELLNWITLNIDIKLDKSLVNKLPKELQNQLSMAIMTGMLKDNNSSYGFNVNYIPKKLMINGEDKSGMLILLEGAL